VGEAAEGDRRIGCVYGPDVLFRTDIVEKVVVALTEVAIQSELLQEGASMIGKRAGGDAGGARPITC
jgi:hypothetical protein